MKRCSLTRAAFFVKHIFAMLTIFLHTIVFSRVIINDNIQILNIDFYQKKKDIYLQYRSFCIKVVNSEEFTYENENR